MSYEEKLPWFPCADGLPKVRGKGGERMGFLTNLRTQVVM